MFAGAFLLMLLGILLPLVAATLLLAGLAFVFNWLLKRGTSSPHAAPRSVPVPLRNSSAPRVPPAPPTSPAVNHSLTGVFTAFVVVVAALVVPWLFPHVQPPPTPKVVVASEGRDRGDRSLVSPRETRAPADTQPAPAPTPASPAEPDSIDTSVRATAPVAADEDPTDVAAIPRTPAQRRRLLAEFAAQVGRLFGRDQATSEPSTTPSANGPVSLGESRNGEVVVLEITQPMVRQLLGDAAGDLLRDMQSRLPQDIREGYALIPLGSSLSSALPPVPPRLAASGLSSLADSLVSILSADSPGDPSPEPVTPQPASPRPAWIDDPPPGSRVVRITQIGNSRVDLERSEQLTQAARQLLLEQATAENLSREYLTVIRSLPIDTQHDLVTTLWSETADADLGSASGTQTVTTEYHLVSLPQDTLLRDRPAVRSQVRSLRTIGLAACTATFWLGLLALTSFKPVASGDRRPAIAVAGLLLVVTVVLGRLVKTGQLAETTADLLGDRLTAVHQFPGADGSETNRRPR